jgi:hypothetical protein
LLDVQRSGLSLAVHPRDAKANRNMVASLILNDIQSNAGGFPEKNAFIQENAKETNIDITRIKITRIRLQKLCAFIKPEIAVGHSLSEGRL